MSRIAPSNTGGKAQTVVGGISQPPSLTASSSGIIRVQKTHGYVAVLNKPFEDERLSWGARGILGYLLTRPDNWQVKTADLISRSRAGRRAVLNMLKELEVCGYLQRTKFQLSNGRWSWQTTVFELPHICQSTAKLPQCVNSTMVPECYLPELQNRTIEQVRNVPSTELRESSRTCASGFFESSVPDPLFSALEQTCGIRYARLNDDKKNLFDEALRWLSEDGRTADQLLGHFAPAWRHYWRCLENHGRPPVPQEVPELWDQVVSQPRIAETATQPYGARGNTNGKVDNAGRISEAAGAFN